MHGHAHDLEFCIDCSSFGNVARFINHSCDPNLFVQCVLNSHYGVKQARLVLFAGRNIRPKQVRILLKVLLLTILLIKYPIIFSAYYYCQ